jgi:uncharacterized membrane protein YozB (DUF420 family)
MSIEDKAKAIKSILGVTIFGSTLVLMVAMIPGLWEILSWALFFALVPMLLLSAFGLVEVGLIKGLVWMEKDEFLSHARS